MGIKGKPADWVSRWDRLRSCGECGHPMTRGPETGWCHRLHFCQSEDCRIESIEIQALEGRTTTTLK
jgi:hypothetical protein